jgi:hypothetical protein
MIRLTRALFSIALVTVGAAAAVAQTGGPPILDTGAILTSADANSDGAVSKAEFVAERAKAFDRLDANKDSTLTRAEFVVAAPSGIRRNFIASQFGAFDTNGDGQLSRAEYNAAPTPGFDRLDANKDAVLSSQEIAAARAGRRAR